MAKKKSSKKGATKKATASKKPSAKPAEARKLGPEVRAKELLKLAKIEFETLNRGELELVRCFALGTVADVSKFAETERSVIPKLIRWLCVSKDACKLADPAGVRLEGATIDGAIDLNAADVPFPIRLRGCTIRGAFECREADLRLLDLQRSSFKGVNGDGVRVRGDVWLRKTPEVTGGVRLLGAIIGGDLSCKGGTFKNENGYAIAADRAEIGGSVFMDTGFNALGEVRLASATIGGSLYCDGGTFKNESKKAMVLQTASIKGGFVFTGVALCDGQVDMTACQVNILIDNLACWPERVQLEGFVYGSIYHSSLGSLEGRRAWLAKHDKTAAGYKSTTDSPFDPQPYRQLADVLRRQGHERFANEIMFTASKKQAAAELDRLREIKESDAGAFDSALTRVADWIIRAWYFLLEHLVGFGYRRWLPVMWLAVYILFGSVVFSGLSWRGVIGAADPTPVVMQPTQGIALRAMEDGDSWVDDYPAFRPIAYSADAFLPLVNLHQETYWTPSHWLVKSVYLPFHIISGWVVTTLAAVSFTGLVRLEGK